MRYTPILEPDDQNWRDWVEKGKTIARKHAAEWKRRKKPKIDDDLYKMKVAKDYLLARYYGKCAYCESKIKNTQPGDVEHYRPKGRVTNGDGSIVKFKLTGRTEVEHPGYWWLAYDWRNLLIACIDCNRRRSHGNQTFGKESWFPVEGKHATEPGREADEEPLLIHPGLDKPEEHLRFERDGYVVWLTKKGRETLELLGLNREDLVPDRRQAYNLALDQITKLFGSWMDLGPHEKRRRMCELNAIWEGYAQFSAAARVALEDYRQGLSQSGTEVALPFRVECPGNPPVQGDARSSSGPNQGEDSELSILANH